MRQLDEVSINLLTGHAAARFRYVDVRNDADFKSRPPQFPVLHLPLDDLEASAADVLEPSTEIVVYGASDPETEEAEDVLNQLGYRSVRAFQGGFDSLARAGLV